MKCNIYLQLLVADISFRFFAHKNYNIIAATTDV